MQVELAPKLTVVGAHCKLETLPPVDAAMVKVTVQVLEALGPRLVGLQAIEETSTELPGSRSQSGGASQGSGDGRRSDRWGW